MGRRNPGSFLSTLHGTRLTRRELVPDIPPGLKSPPIIIFSHSHPNDLITISQDYQYLFVLVFVFAFISSLYNCQAYPIDDLHRFPCTPTCTRNPACRCSAFDVTRESESPWQAIRLARARLAHLRSRHLSQLALPLPLHQQNSAPS